MRRLARRVVCVIAGFVYQRGVELYRLSDWIDDETDTTEPEMIAMWNTDEPTTTANGTAKVTWTKSGSS